MLARLQNSALGVAACICMALPGQSRAQGAGSDQQFIVGAWAAFIEWCTPFIENPAAARNALPRQGAGLFIAGTEDHAHLDYVQELDDEKIGIGVVMEETRNYFYFTCYTNSYRDFPAENLAESATLFRSLVAQTGSIEMVGGPARVRIENGSPVTGEDPLLYYYILNGVFEGRETHLVVAFDVDELALEVDVRIDKVDLS